METSLELTRERMVAAEGLRLGEIVREMRKACCLSLERMLLAWGLKERLESSVTPRYLYESEKGMDCLER